MSKTVVNKTNKQTSHKLKSWYSNRYQLVLVQRNILLLFMVRSKKSGESLIARSEGAAMTSDDGQRHAVRVESFVPQ